MFREAKIVWDYLLWASVTLVLEQYGITEGVLVLDESDRQRSKRTSRIYGADKQKYKASGGMSMVRQWSYCYWSHRR